MELIECYVADEQQTTITDTHANWYLLSFSSLLHNIYKYPEENRDCWVALSLWFNLLFSWLLLF